MAGSKKSPLYTTISLAEWLDMKEQLRAAQVNARALVSALDGATFRAVVLENRLRVSKKKVSLLETKLKYNSAVYSEGGSGEYVSNEQAMNRFEVK